MRREGRREREELDKENTEDQVGSRHMEGKKRGKIKNESFKKKKKKERGKMKKVELGGLQDEKTCGIKRGKMGRNGKRKGKRKQKETKRKRKENKITFLGYKRENKER